VWVTQGNGGRAELPVSTAQHLTSQQAFPRFEPKAEKLVVPILARETDLFPENLLDAGLARQPSWWTLYTLSRREKQLMRLLQAMEIPFYSPLVPKRSRSLQGRIRTSYMPLFLGYVFINGDAEQRQLAMTSNCISRWIEVPHGEELRADLQQIQRLVESGVPLTVESRIEPGQAVRVKSGAFASIEGYVLKRHSSTRLVVAVNFTQQGASVLLDDFQVELI